MRDVSHVASSGHRAAILSLPQGSGKSTIAPALAQHLGCTQIVDEWHPGAGVTPGALHLTSVGVVPAAATKRPSPAMKQAQQRLQAAIAKRREEMRKPA